MPAILWSSAIVVSTWPVLLPAPERALGGRRSIAAAVLTTLLTLLLLVPLLLGIIWRSSTTRLGSASGWSRSPPRTMPPPPAWLEQVPFAGERIANAWRQVVDDGAQGLFARLAPMAAAS